MEVGLVAHVVLSPQKSSADRRFRSLPQSPGVCTAHADIVNPVGAPQPSPPVATRTAGSDARGNVRTPNTASLGHDTPARALFCNSRREAPTPPPLHASLSTPGTSMSNPRVTSPRSPSSQPLSLPGVRCATHRSAAELRARGQVSPDSPQRFAALLAPPLQRERPAHGLPRAGHGSRDETARDQAIDASPPGVAGSLQPWPAAQLPICMESSPERGVIPKPPASSATSCSSADSLAMRPSLAPERAASSAAHATLRIPDRVEATIDLRARAVAIQPHTSVEGLATERLVRDLAQAGWVARTSRVAQTARVSDPSGHASSESPSRHRLVGEACIDDRHRGRRRRDEPG